jgi:hypothetical protein
LFEGVAGLGKSRLLGEALTLAEAAGMRALRGRGSEAEREFAFGVVLQIVMVTSVWCGSTVVSFGG